MNPEKSAIPLIISPNDSNVTIEPNQDNIEDMKQLNGIDANFVVDTDPGQLTEKRDSNARSSTTRVEMLASTYLKKVLTIIGVVLYSAYFITALVFGATRDCVNTIPLIILTCLILSYFVFGYIFNRFGADVRERCIDPCVVSLHDKQRILKVLLVCLVLGGLLIVLIITAISQPINLISVVGFLFFAVVCYICSEHRKQIKWRPVLGGFLLQFFFAVIILKWDLGYKFFVFLGKGAQMFIGYTDAGSRMVFGDNFIDHFFVMKVLPVIVFFSSFIFILYHFGVMQAIIRNIAFIMRILLDTTAAESLCAAGNIFVGLTEAPILIGPFLPLMTKSELHAVMTGGFATIAGGVMAAYISFGVPSEHLLCASVMSAPCALAVSKLLFPETEESRISNKTHIENQPSSYRNVIEAAAAGASESIGLVASIAANLIAFLALLAFVNAVLSWFGGFICLPELSFEMICSYLFMPVAFLMGVEWKDAGIVAELIGIKTFLNEFVAYEKLAEFIKNRQDCLDGVTLSIRTEVISTYALCGFSNLSTIGILLGGLTPMAPNRASDLANIVVKALFGGVITCLMTACVAGLLVVHTPEDLLVNCAGNFSNSTFLESNATEPTTSELYSVLTNNTMF